MHEEALLKDLHRKLAELAAEHPGERITRVTLSVGALSHLTDHGVRSRWAETVRDTGAEDARLELRQRNDPSDPLALGIVLESIGLEPTPSLAKPVRGR